MSDSNVIHDMSKTLSDMLELHLNTPERPVRITVDSPLKENQEEPRVNLYLYALTPDPRRNSFRVETSSVEVVDPTTGQTLTRKELAKEPLAFNYHYLLTAYAQDGFSEHRLLGEVMQLFYTWQYIPEDALYGTLRESDVRSIRVQLVLENVPLETLNQIWGSSSQMRTSLAYEVSVAFLEPLTERTVAMLPKGVTATAVQAPVMSYISPESAPAGATVRIYGSHFVQDATQGTSWLKVWFGDTEATPTSVRDRALDVVVPSSLQRGRLKVRLQLQTLTSSERPFEVT